MRILSYDPFQGRVQTPSYGDSLLPFCLPHATLPHWVRLSPTTCTICSILTGHIQQQHEIIYNIVYETVQRMSLLEFKCFSICGFGIISKRKQRQISIFFFSFQKNSRKWVLCLSVYLIRFRMFEYLLLGMGLR